MQIANNAFGKLKIRDLKKFRDTRLGIGCIKES